MFRRRNHSSGAADFSNRSTAVRLRMACGISGRLGERVC